MSQLTYEHVTMQFQDVTALENVSFTLESGHIYGLLGRNGAGKSTLLSLSAGGAGRRPGACCWTATLFGKMPRLSARLSARATGICSPP